MLTLLELPVEDLSRAIGVPKEGLSGRLVSALVAALVLVPPAELYDVPPVPPLVL